MSHFSRCMIAALAALSLTACADSESSSCTTCPDEPAAVADNATPEAAFDAARAAAEAGDWDRFTAQLTPEAQDQMAGVMVMTVAMMKAMSEALGDMTQEMADGMAEALGGEPADVEMKKSAENPLAALDALLAKHGIDEEAMKDSPPPLQGDDMAAGLAKLAEPLKDKRAFIVEAFAALEASEKGDAAGGPQMDGRLTDLEVDGDHATAMLTTDEGARPMEFHRIDGSWLMALPLETR